MAKKDNVHLQLTEELNSIDAELEDAMEALSATNQRIDSYLNDDEDAPEVSSAKPAAEIEDDQAGEQADGEPTSNEGAPKSEDLRAAEDTESEPAEQA